MMYIGKVYYMHEGEWSRICADISIDGTETRLWFGVEGDKAKYLCGERSDPFLAALLPTAITGGHKIVCESPVSARLKYQLETFLIPVLQSMKPNHTPIDISAPVTAKTVDSARAVGTCFSGNEDSLHSVLSHEKDSEYPVTHIAAFNDGMSEGNERDSFLMAYEDAERFAAENGLQAIGLDSNLSEVLSKQFVQEAVYRNLACALALQGLFSVYLFTSAGDAAKLSGTHSGYEINEMVITHCLKTESTAIYLLRDPA